MIRDTLLIIFGFCAIGFGYTAAYNRHVCQFNVQVPYTRKVNKTEIKPFVGTTYKYGQATRYRNLTSAVEETAFKFEIQSKCCPGYEGPIENCQRTSTTSQDIASSSSESPLFFTEVTSADVTESSTRLYHVMESSRMSTETLGDNTKTYSESIATKVDWSFPIWFFCIVVLVAFVAMLVKLLVNRNDRRAYVVNKKCASTESHC